MDEVSLRPNRRVQKLLLSTPARFEGEFSTPDLLISHAWPPIYAGRSRWFDGAGDSLGRTAIVLAFRSPPHPELTPGLVIPNYEYVGEVLASALSVLFGKRFDSHGPFEMSGFFGMPDFSSFATPCDPRLKHNDSRPRADRSVPLDLAQAVRISGLVLGESKDPRVDAFHSAAKFYRRALLTIEVDPESAYLNLITAGEIISNTHSMDEVEALDSEVREILDLVARGLPNGERLANVLRGRLRGIKRRFVSAIVEMIDDTFFERREASDQYSSFKKDGFRERISAAYDLRSRFLHSGYPFGGWISSRMADHEVPIGKPALLNKEMAAVLARAPLLSGLERVIRYVLLTFAGKLGATVDVPNELIPKKGHD